MKVKYKKNGEDKEHCLALLSYVARNRDEPQSISQLARECGIPKTSLYRILTDATIDKTHSLLYGMALQYGFEFYIYQDWNYLEFPSPKNVIRGMVIDVERRPIHKAER